MANRFASINITTDHKFCGETVKIRKLTVDQVAQIQKLAKIVDNSKESDENENASRNLLETMIKAGVGEFEEFSSEDFGSLPIDELSKLSNAIMRYSGFGK